MIKCTTCAALLRQVDGLHQPGEPYMQADDDGSFMVCLKCETRVRWQDDEPAAANFDLGDDTAIA